MCRRFPGVGGQPGRAAHHPRADDLADDAYRYGYAPAAERAAAGYAFLRSAAERAGVSAAEWRRWEAECVRPPFARHRCLQDFRDAPAGE